jgi:hypothetical protein
VRQRKQSKPNGFSLALAKDEKIKINNIRRQSSINN